MRKASSLAHNAVSKFTYLTSRLVSPMPRTYLIFGDIAGKLDVLRVECKSIS